MKRVDKINNHILKNIVCKLLPSTTTTNFQLDAVCKNILKKYIGTFALDEVPKKLKKGECFIFNLDYSHQGGSHWMGAYCYKDDTILVYDSFGRKTSNIASDINEYLNVLDTEYDAEQHEEETSCGARCVAFLLICEMFGYKLASEL